MALRKRSGTRPGARPDNPAKNPEHDEADEISRLRGRYLDLMKGALTHTIYRPMDIVLEDTGLPPDDDDDELREAVKAEMSKPGFDWADVRANGRDWPRFAQTMVGLRRLDNVQWCVEQVLADDVPGDLIETGVWRGGVVIFMRAILDAHGDETRTVFAADSFRGLPPPDEESYPADAESKLHLAKPLAISRADVERNFSLYGLLDERVQFLEGWFADTLPRVADRTWSVVRLDGDMYGSTMDALNELYPRLSPGGFLIVDDYGWDFCRQAVTDYRTANGIDDPIETIDWVGAFWRRRP